MNKLLKILNVVLLMAYVAVFILALWVFYSKGWIEVCAWLLLIIMAQKKLE